MKNVIRIMATENKPLVISSPILVPNGSVLVYKEGITIVNGCNADDIAINTSKNNYK